MATVLAGVGAVFNFGFLYVRSLALKTVPYSDLLGSMALFGLFLAAMSLILEARHHDRSLGPFLMPVSLFFLLLSFVVPGGGRLEPELRGSVFAFHVTLNMLSYSAFAVACALSLLYLVLGRQLKSKRHNVLNGPVSRLPSLSYLERAARTSIGVGVVSLAAGLTMGFLWAYRVWQEEHPGWILDAKIWGAVATLAFYLWVFVRAHRGAAPGDDGEARRRRVRPRPPLLHRRQPLLLEGPLVHLMPPEIVFVGWNHQGADLDLRARLAFTPEKAREALEGLFRERILTEGAVVSTCNRAEVYGVSEVPDSFEALAGFFSRFHSVDASVLREKALSGRGEATVRHLFRVASGLDSMVLGEAQILGQIREAHRRAAEAGTARAVTSRLFQSALECGKRVRTETSLGARPVSVPGIALSLVGRIFESISELQGPPPRGGGDGRADGAPPRRRRREADPLREPLAREGEGARDPLPRLDRAVGGAGEGVRATSTSSSRPRAPRSRSSRQRCSSRVLGRGRRRGPLLILDLAVPRDIETKVEEFSDVYRYDLDALGELACDNTRDRMADVPHAERIVEESTQKFLGWLAGLSHVDTLRTLRERFEKARRDEIERYSGKLSRLSPDDRAVVERMTETLLQKILHNPTIGLKEGDASERLTRAAVVRALFKLDDGE